MCQLFLRTYRWKIKYKIMKRWSRVITEEVRYERNCNCNRFKISVSHCIVFEVIDSFIWYHSAELQSCQIYLNRFVCGWLRPWGLVRIHWSVSAYITERDFCCYLFNFIFLTSSAVNWQARMMVQMISIEGLCCIHLVLCGEHVECFKFVVNVLNCSGDSEYELVLQTDLYTKRHTQWFYFRVTNTRPNCIYSFKIINLLKSDSLYNYGKNSQFQYM